MSHPSSVLSSLASLLSAEQARAAAQSAPPLAAFDGAAGAALLSACSGASSAAAAPSAAATTAALEARTGMTLAELPRDRLPTSAAFSAVLRGEAPEEAPQRRAARANLVLQGIFLGEEDR